MKKSLLPLALAVIVAAVACDPKESGKPISVSVSVSEEKIEEGLPTPSSYSVYLTNTNTMAVTEAVTENGVAVFPSILSGIYNVSVSGSVVEGSCSYTYGGTLDKLKLTTNGQEVLVEVAAVKESALVFKEIYYAGCTSVPATDPNDPSSAVTYFRDQFYEIYNNSDETVYADGLCIATTIAYDYTFSTPFTYHPEGNADDYVYVQDIFQMPGEGNTYPIAPGESIVIAQWATNHTDPSLAGEHGLDTSSAEFECLTKIGEIYGATITDNPNSINATYHNAKTWVGPQWLTSCSGAPYIIFRPSKPIREADFLNPDEEENNARAIEILKSDIIDAVEAVQDETRLSTLCLPSDLDAGCIWVSAPGSYTGESISRKIKETKKDGRVIYQDTNNTTNDFEVNAKPELRRNGAKVPSWHKF